MPARINSPGVAEIDMLYTYNGQLVMNRFHVKREGAWDSAMLNTLAAAFITWFDTFMKSGASNGLTLNAVRATDLSTANNPQVIVTTGLPSTGTGGTADLPNNVTVAVKWTTGLRGRSARGRTYHLGLHSNQIAVNTVVTGSIAGLKAAYEELIAAVEGASDGVLSVLSERTGNAPRTEGIAYQIVGVDINPTLDSQRRRLPERGA